MQRQGFITGVAMLKFPFAANMRIEIAPDEHMPVRLLLRSCPRPQTLDGVWV
jgi:hypothetical protein